MQKQNNKQGLGRQTNSNKKRKLRKKARQLNALRLQRSQNNSNSNGGRGNARLTGTYRLSDCASLYAASLLKPFVPSGACVPTFPSIPSEKVFTFVRGSASIGTEGVGFLLAHPSFIPNKTLQSITWSNAAWTGIVFPQDTTATGIMTQAMNSPYSQTDITSGLLQVRPVSLGLRVRYTGTELNRSGTIYMLEEPDHQSLYSKGVADLLAYDTTYSSSVTRGWHELIIKPVSPAEVEYRNGLYIEPDQAIDRAFAGILFTGVPGQTFDFEVCCNFEAIGQIARGKTPNTVDEQGHSSVLGYVSEGIGRLMTPSRMLSGLSSVLSLATKAITGNTLGMAMNAIQSGAPRLLLQ